MVFLHGLVFSIINTNCFYYLYNAKHNAAVDSVLCVRRHVDIMGNVFAE